MNRTYFILLSAFVAACSSSDTSTKPTTAQYDDTAQAIASTTASSGSGNAGAAAAGGDVVSMSLAVAIALGETPPGFAVLGDGHMQGSRLGVDYSYMMSCKTAAGVVALCGPTTAQATVDVTWSGMQSSEHADATVSRSGTWEVRDLQSGVATLSGDSTFTVDASLRSVFRPSATARFSFEAQASYMNVFVSTEQHRVLDGMASFAISATEGSAKFEAKAEVTFFADQTADLWIDETEHYTIDVEAGAVARAN